MGEGQGNSGLLVPVLFSLLKKPKTVINLIAKYKQKTLTNN